MSMLMFTEYIRQFNSQINAIKWYKRIPFLNMHVFSRHKRKTHISVNTNEALVDVLRNSRSKNTMKLHLRNNHTVYRQ